MIPIPISLLLRLLKALDIMTKQGARYEDTTLMQELDEVLARFERVMEKQ